MFDEVKFNIEKENWNEYELMDGAHRVTLRMRAVLTMVLKPKIMKINEPSVVGIPNLPMPISSQRRSPKDEFQLSFQNLVVVSDCPAELMGDPTPPVPPVELDKIANEEIEFSAFNEDWNVYITENDVKLKIKLIVSSVKKAPGNFDQLGYPLYVVQSTNAVVATPPKTKENR